VAIIAAPKKEARRVEREKRLLPLFLFSGLILIT